MNQFFEFLDKIALKLIDLHAYDVHSQRSPYHTRIQFNVVRFRAVNGQSIIRPD